MKLEKYRIEGSQKAVSSGVSMINHAIKNEILKIDLISQNIKRRMKQQGLEDAEFTEDLSCINQSATYMMEMITRINSQTREIKLNEVPCCLTNLIEETIELNRALFEHSEISIANAVQSDEVVHLDQLHFKEVLTNLFKNGVEAMEKKGCISLELIKKGKDLTLVVADNGSGISKEALKHVLDPFYSTKNQILNFGLGLSFCYTVMEQHGGSLEIESTIGEGTRVMLHFARKKVVS